MDLARRLQWRERPQRRPAMFQTWSNLLFAHWEIPRDVIQSSLPPGLTADTWEGRAYLGIVPFFMRGIRPNGVPSFPWISNFLELNVRTYVHDEHGNPGVWFYSLDCNQPVAVWLARALLGLPYQHAKMCAARQTDGSIDFHSQRRSNGMGARFLYGLDSASTLAEPGSLEFFLVERYLLFTWHHRRLFRAQVHHAPYALSAATLRTFHIRDVVPAWPASSEPPIHLTGSAGVDVEIFGAEAVA